MKYSTLAFTCTMYGEVLTIKTFTNYEPSRYILGSADSNRKERVMQPQNRPVDVHLNQFITIQFNSASLRKLCETENRISPAACTPFSPRGTVQSEGLIIMRYAGERQAFFLLCVPMYIEHLHSDLPVEIHQKSALPFLGETNQQLYRHRHFLF